MNEPIRTQWQIRCAFNGYCKRALQNEMLAAKRDIKRRQRREVTFSDLTSQEEKQLFQEVNVSSSVHKTSMRDYSKNRGLILSENIPILQLTGN